MFEISLKSSKSHLGSIREQDRMAFILGLTWDLEVAQGLAGARRADGAVRVVFLHERARERGRESGERAWLGQDEVVTFQKEGKEAPARRRPGM